MRQAIRLATATAWAATFTLAITVGAAGVGAAEVEAGEAGTEGGEGFSISPTLPVGTDVRAPAADLTGEEPSAASREAVDRQVEAADSDPAATPPSRQGVLLDRIAHALAEPPVVDDRVEVRRRLSELIRDSSELALVADDDNVRLDAYSLHMQALHAYISAFPYDARVETYLARLRSTADRARALGGGNARAIGDFWALTAELVTIGRSDADVAQQRAEMEPLLARYVDQHSEHPAAYAVREMLRDLQAPPESAASEAESAPTDGDSAADADTPSRSDPPRRPAFRVPFDLDEDEGG